MRCGPWASFLAHNLASPCLGREPKAKVATDVIADALTYHQKVVDHPHLDLLFLLKVQGNYQVLIC
jgi:hypothetical protein